MERRYHLHNSPYLANNPYLNSFGSRYATKPQGVQLWGSHQPREQHISCTLPTILVLVLVILGVLAIAGLAIYMAALRLEPVQSYLVFDGSMRVLGDRYNNNLANKTSSFYAEKSKKYQTLLEAVYAASLLGASVQEIIVNSFANGSLIIFFRVILNRKFIPKPVSSIEDTLKTVILQEASSPLSVLNELKIDPKELIIKRVLDQPKPFVMNEDFSLNRPLAKKILEKSSAPELKISRAPVTTETNWPTVTGDANVKTLPSHMIQGTYTVTSNEPKLKKKDDMSVVTPSLTLTTKKLRSTTETPDIRFGMRHSPALKQYLQHSSEKESTTKPTTVRPTTSKPTTKIIKEAVKPSTHFSDEPWMPMMPNEEKRNFRETVDFDYGVGEAEVIETADPSSKHPSIPRMKNKPHSIPAIIEEVQISKSPTEEPKTTPRIEKVNKPKIVFRSDLMSEQKSMPELSILQQFHDLDTLLRNYNTKKPTTVKPPDVKTPEIDKLSPSQPSVVTLLPVRSNVGVGGPLRPRPKLTTTPTMKVLTTPESTDTKAELSISNPLHSTTRETMPTNKQPSEKIFIDQNSDLVAIPLQKYFATTKPILHTTNHTTHENITSHKPKPTSKSMSYVTENLKEIAIVTTNDDDIASKREIRQSSKQGHNRKAKMPAFFRPNRENLENEMKLDIEEIFQNLTTTSRSVSDKNNSKEASFQKIDFTMPNSSFNNPFNLNKTQFLLNKLAKLQIASNESRNNTKYNRDKVSNKAVATSHAGNVPFRLLTKVFNKSQTMPKPDTSTSEKTLFESTGCIQNNTFLCGSGECLPNHLKCNKLMDCRDGSDEKNCTCADFLRNQYHTRKICDGIYDCWDYSDEQGCDWCSPGQHMCANSRMCIDPSQVCDGFPQCPYGDDEKNCITVAQSLETANNKDYYPNGYLMVKKEGEWGKMCLQNFDNVISKSKTDWSLQDLGQSVCKTLSYKNFDGITRQKDVTPRNMAKAPVYYELALSNDRNDSYNSKRSASFFREKFAFQKTTCIEKEVAQVACSNLECGIRPEANIPWTNERRSRIVGGGNAGPGSWPWQAALYKEGEFQCGATLISETWLLSAGHCFYNAQNDYWVARMGALRRETPPAPYEQLRPITKVVLHPEYEDQGFINDISLLRMNEPIVLTSFVRPICLPEENKEPRDGAMCTVVGWGQLYEIGRVFPDTLQEVQLPVISTAECRKRTIFLPLYKVTDNMFCAGYERGGRDACLGDSGGPLMCQESDGRWTLTGVTSNGYGCARANRPGVYTKVVNYLPWVRETLLIIDEISSPPVCHGHRCPLGECLPPARLCNGYIECRDSSDESGCW
ncbi:serine protease nudel-like [Cimex lectularius]|uniref:Serine protease n=1 Tax=Cimex lectularius TaxID=79782 RepID=A0A8I6SUD0_CIMLE|nr:serine protease nudel-like [Cimex lectularius]